MTAKAMLATITMPTVIAAAIDVISKSCRDWLSIARSPRGNCCGAKGPPPVARGACRRDPPVGAVS
jgi:hypothetical protein